MQIRLDVDACVGHGRCYAIDPDVFEPDDLGHCVVVRAEVPPDDEERARRAVDACPEGALAVDG
ncbi:ferredoxin [Dermatobacter hominis]|uniref:ferredoxin n=1 Tax=Dermatobacter hominis TaxID=2884263 RepID=UPI001D11F271|nr:ferredoxin [Dermatobacter hominis]UDY35028.1 ferredoxin [Dermatobacter hominis]